MLSTLLDQRFDREYRVEAATVRPEAVLVLVIQRSTLLDRFEPNEDDVASDLHLDTPRHPSTPLDTARHRSTPLDTARHL